MTVKDLYVNFKLNEAVITLACSRSDIKTGKREIWINGKYLETCSNLDEAINRVARYEREDRYEVEVEGYAVGPKGFPVYEIKEVSK